jgi:excisionase family DNA binding protein
MPSSNEGQTLRSNCKGKPLSAAQQSPGTLMTVTDVAATLKVSTRTLYRWIKSGDLPVRRLGRSIRIDREELDRFVAAH